uniref:Nuclear RNA export factor 2 (inferred by orthology to a D. melanogaster protein) n=1 Tax=Strongyloides venezuelensis TaxID=75913 RepID=A0A0K0F888_STRVS
MIFTMLMLKILDLSCNFIGKVPELSRIRIWKIEELFPENTGISNFFTKTSEYPRTAQGYFPYLKSLVCLKIVELKYCFQDGIPIKVNNYAPVISDEQNVTFKPSFSPSKDIETVLKMFVVQYYDIFYGPNRITTRKQLSKAYDENAIFLHVFETIKDGNQVGVSKSFKILRGPCYKSHRKSSHNILFEDKFNLRRKET